MQGHTTVTELAAAWKMDRKTLLLRIAEAGIRPRKPNRQPVLTAAEIERVLEATRTRSPPLPPPLVGRDARAAVADARRRKTKQIAKRVRHTAGIG